MPKRKQFREWNQSSQYNKKLTENVQILLTPGTMLEIKRLLDIGVFPNISEFGRWAIRNSLDKYYEISIWRKKLKL